MYFNATSTFKILALVVVVTLLTARLGQFSQNALFAPIQNYLSNKDQITEGGIKKGPLFCKSKPLPDLFAPADKPIVPPPFSPDVFVLRTLLAAGAPEGISQEIFIPPEFLA